MPVPWDLIAMGIDAGLVALFYAAYKKNTVAAQTVNSAPEYQVGNEIKDVLENSPNRLLPYACVAGFIEPVGTPLQSIYQNEQKGVIQKITLVEHRSKRTQGFWSDCKQTLRDATNHVPFILKSSTPDQPSVHVWEPMAAEQIIEDLKVTYDKFEPNKSTMMEKGIDRLFGDVSKGVQETERMLEVGVYLAGFGKIIMSGPSNTIKLLPPEENQPYILTRLSKSEVVRLLYSRARTMKIFMMIFGSIGIGLMAYYIFKKFRKWQQDRDFQRALEDFRESQREGSSTAQINQNSGHEDDESRNCVICLDRPREVIVLDCGHVCMCAACSSMLPRPPKCPVCRNDVRKLQPIYVS